MLAHAQNTASGAGRIGVWGGGPNHFPADEWLVRRIAAGDGMALRQIYDRYVRLVFSIAYRRTQDAACAEEIVQEVFCKVWRRGADYRPERGRFSSWLIGIAEHQSIDELRRRRVRPVMQSAEEESVPVATEGNPGDVLDHALDRARVAGALAQIPPAQRAVIELAFFEGLSHPEIADRCGMPLGTVKARIRLGMTKLKGLLQE